ncbi:MAG: FAD-dependent oxidoreductase [Bacteroidetes bacterium]|nr:FAD-dependent oxidoreductase [Bacteroidota bacterium]MBK8486395.1 FAD-dependent oxidoreductase [Bacteroidota bacterium]MBP8754782.1 FAD-dependent oxidoreductase [Chitinophagales bacterium]MBP9705440.1 FAD-dependent oxidoreductase [Chitinophagales bacterium]
MKKVIVIGGGVAGMSAAQELAERGMQVEVYERNPWYAGGKARSVNVPDTNLLHPDKYLPGEHGFRFFPGFYKHITDSMKRIPFTNENGEKNANGVYDNLTQLDRVMIAEYGKLPIISIVNFPHTISDFKVLFHSAFGSNTGLTKADIEFFAERVWQLMTSCSERRMNEYERLGWWEYMDADGHSEIYQHLLVEGLTRTLVAAKAKLASTKTGGDIFIQLLFNITNPHIKADRVLNGPTNEKFIYPWMAYLKSMQVDYQLGWECIDLKIEKDVITGVVLKHRQSHEEKTVTGDYYLLATPVEVASKLFQRNPAIINADSTLADIDKLAPDVSWMNGIQFYLSEDVKVNHGHVIYSDSQWALTSISQMQFWGKYDLNQRGNGKVKGVLSVDISDWTTKGFNGMTANECTQEQVKDEVWKQLKESLNVEGKEILKDDMLLFWYLDKDIHKVGYEKDVNFEPLLVNLVNTWSLRPQAYTQISNLFLAADYVKTYTDLATMEGANEAARRAVNSIMDATGEKYKIAEVWNLHEPILLSYYKWLDRRRYKKGMPWKIHVPWFARVLNFIFKFIYKH